MTVQQTTGKRGGVMIKRKFLSILSSVGSAPGEGQLMTSSARYAKGSGSSKWIDVLLASILVHLMIFLKVIAT